MIELTEELKNTLKQCFMCKELKKISEFKIRKSKNGYSITECKICSNLRGKTNYHKRKKKMGIKSIKIVKCPFCEWVFDTLVGVNNHFRGKHSDENKDEFNR